METTIRMIVETILLPFVMLFVGYCIGKWSNDMKEDSGKNN
jgi:hypothetical protein